MTLTIAVECANAAICVWYAEATTFISKFHELSMGFFSKLFGGAKEAADKTVDMAGDAANAAGDAAMSAADTAGDMAGKAADTAMDAGAAAVDMAGDAAEAVVDTASDVAAGAADMAGDAVEATKNKFDGDPTT